MREYPLSLRYIPRSLTLPWKLARESSKTSIVDRARARFPARPSFVSVANVLDFVVCGHSAKVKYERNRRVEDGVRICCISDFLLRLLLLERGGGKTAEGFRKREHGKYRIWWRSFVFSRLFSCEVNTHFVILSVVVCWWWQPRFHNIVSVRTIF